MPKFSPVVPRRRRITSSLAVLALAVLTAAGCDSSTGNDDSISSLSVNPSAPVMHVGGVQQLVATPATSSGKIIEGRTATWNSSNPAVATVDGNGLVTAIAGGTTTVSATLGGVSDEAAVTVWFPVTALSIASEGDVTDICKEGSVQLLPTFTDASGSPVTGRQVAWTTADAATAEVTPRGLVIGRELGTTEITGTVDGVSDVFTVDVTCEPIVDAVELTAPMGPHILVGDTVHLSGIPSAASGTDLDLTGRTVVWTSGNTSVATVDADGILTMVAEGEANIGLSVDGVEADSLTVVGHPAANSVTPGTPLVIGTIPAGERHIWLVEIPVGADTIDVKLSGGSGDPDLRLYSPTASEPTCTSGSSGPNESCVRGDPAPGRWRIDIEAWSGAGSASGTTITVRSVVNP